MNKIYLVRHCEPCSRDYDNTMRNLSEDGYKNAEKTSDFLINEKVDMIFSSPYKRALETIEPFSKKSSIGIVEVNDFRERKISSKSIENFDEFAEKQWEDFSFKLEEGESLEEVQERNVTAFKKILKENLNKNIVISGHGTAISTILNHYSDFGFENFFELKDVMPFIVEMEFEGEEFKSYTIYKF